MHPVVPRERHCRAPFHEQTCQRAYVEVRSGDVHVVIVVYAVAVVQGEGLVEGVYRDFEPVAP